MIIICYTLVIVQRSSTTETFDTYKQLNRALLYSASPECNVADHRFNVVSDEYVELGLGF